MSSLKFSNDEIARQRKGALRAANDDFPICLNSQRLVSCDVTENF
jgi:hypothetical protein